MIKKCVNILFALLFLCTVLFGIHVLAFECAADGIFAVVALIYGPLVAAIVFGCEYFWWRGVLLLVSYTDEKPVIVIASVVNIVLSSASLIYKLFGALFKVGLPFSYVLYAFAVQLFCRLLIWIHT